MARCERLVGGLCMLIVALVGAGFGFLLGHESLAWAGAGALLYGGAMGYIVRSTRD